MRLLNFAILVLCISTLRAESLHSDYDPDTYFSRDLGRTELSPLEKLRIIISNLAVYPGQNGATPLPRGTVVDNTAIEDNILVAWVTLPVDVKSEKLNPEHTGQIGAILRYHFADLDFLAGHRVYARIAGEDAFNSLNAYVARQEIPQLDRVSNPFDNWYEPDGPGPMPDPDYEAWFAKLREMEASDTKKPNYIAGQAMPSGSGMPTGALAGRIIFTYGGHGRCWDGDASTPYWRFQRPSINGMMEDFGNADASDAYAYYCFNAGATIVSFRPIGYQNNEVIVDNTAATFTGAWSNSVSTRYYGSATPPYRYASTNVNETATAQYTPNIPSAGYYPVYTWVNYGSDRVPGQLYKIKTTGGETLIRVDHRRVGCGWIYLGTYWFNAGSNPETGSVIISNQNPPGHSTVNVVIADAIRFGNGIGDVNNGGGISGYSRREESTVYWIQNGWGNGTSFPSAATIWNNSNTADDEMASWSAPPEMAQQMYRVHSDTTVAEKKYALFLGWHSNASSNTNARGSVGLITPGNTTNQAWWAARVCDQLDAASLDEDANWEHLWSDRTSSTYEDPDGYGEISNGNLGSEMDATIIEVGYHTSPDDARLMRDPKVRNVHARGAYHAAVQYFNNFRDGLLAYSPETPVRFSVVNDGTGGVTLSWQPGPTGGTKGDAATSYRLYQSLDGLGFNSGTAVATTQHTIHGLTPGQTYFFRVAGVNAGGESFPTEVLSVKVKNTEPAKILIVNGYDRMDRHNNIVRSGISPSVDQLIHHLNNSYNYVRQHASAIAAAGMAFDSCDNESIINNDVLLGSYECLVWIAGEESSADDTFNATERARVSSFINTGNKKLFVSGAEIGYEIAGQSIDLSFYNNILGASYINDDGGSYQATGVAGTVLAGLTMNFAPGTSIYDADYPDRIGAYTGSTVAANYTGGGSGGAAIQFTGGVPHRRIIHLGFPFECINSTTTQNQIMAAAIAYFDLRDEVPTASMDWQLYN